ncbi:MAG: twin-arginine translocase subunit TatC [Verrucomicrobiaceae bacterium]|nr:twin-arginine translocase subunit TatC [Verrucomicrobiaceae bacterium]
MWQGILNKVFKAREKFALNLAKEDEEKPFLEHLEDLRTMIVRMVLTIILSVIGTFVFHKQLFYFIKLPLLNAGIVKTMEETINYLRSNGPAETFMAMVNLSLIAAVIISFPLLLLFILQFILPGLKDNEKKLLFPAIAVGAGLFLTGVTFAYFVVLPKALYFFEEFGRSMGVRQDWTLGDYITFATRFVLVFGIAFELPVIVMALVKLDILNYKLMKSTWRHAIIGITLFAAIITPTPDVLTLALMSGPLYILYAICIWLAYFMEKKDREMYPEYYAQIEKDAEELEKAGPSDAWDNDDYNPWSSNDENDDGDDDEGYRKKDAPTDQPKPPADSEPKKDSEKSLEDYSEEDQARNTGG